MTQTFHSHGKFLLTGEYLVLKGALSLALPLKPGQSLDVERLATNKNRIVWEAYLPEGTWFTSTIERSGFEGFSSNNAEKSMSLLKILSAVKSLNPNAFDGNDLKFVTCLDFNPNWGLGSSSTLISNLARWANVNPYELLKLTFGGSGYDIACATTEQPIYYQLINFEPALRQAQGPQEYVPAKVPELVEGPTSLVEPIAFHPPFAEHLFFVYLGQKQTSSKEVKAFLETTNPIDLQKDIEAVSEISRALPQCQTLDEFCMLLQCHERLIARCIGQEPVQKRFPDFEGTLKSLGAWGGDFILAATEWNENQVRAYFEKHGLEVVFGYDALALTSHTKR